jgi:hypothetical protein
VCNQKKGGKLLGKEKPGKRTDDPKIFQTRIRMSEEDTMYLDYCVKMTGKSKADIIREGIRKIYLELKGKE